MKKTIILLIVVCGVLAGALVYVNRPKTPPAPAPIAEAPSQPTEHPPLETISVSKPEQTSTPSTNSIAPTLVATAAPATDETNSPASTNSISKTVDALLHAKGEKHNLFEQLRASGQLDAVIAELQQRAAANPTDPEIATTLGEAQLNKIRTLKDAGADRNELGILALQADQNFNTALKADPKNWEAQFVKASSMFYWPSDPERDADVVQRLSSLIDQQDGMTTQPEFAQPYIVLGNEYEKIGKHAEAVATWTLGAQKFPTDPTLQKKMGGQ